MDTLSFVNTNIHKCIYIYLYECAKIGLGEYVGSALVEEVEREGERVAQ